MVKSLLNILVQFSAMTIRHITYRSIDVRISIPEWLNEEAAREGVNFSQVLQEALIQKSQG